MEDILLRASCANWGYVEQLPPPLDTPGTRAAYGMADADGRYYVYQAVGLSQDGVPMKEVGVHLGAGFYGPHLIVYARRGRDPVEWDRLGLVLRERGFKTYGRPPDEVWLYRGFSGGKSTWDKALLYLPGSGGSWAGFEKWARGNYPDNLWMPGGMSFPYAEIQMQAVDR